MNVDEWLLDLSNVATVPGTNGREARWERVDEVVRLLMAQQHAPVFGVADRSLYYGKLDEAGKRRLREWQSRGRALLEPWADPALCERATDRPDAHIVSNDNFRGLRRMYPILQGFDRIWGFKLQNDISVHRRALASLGEAEISRAEEDEERTPKRLRTGTGLQMLEWEWMCTNPACPWSSFPAIEELPVNVDGTATCPQCREPLNRGGRAEATRAIKVAVDAQVVERVPVPVSAALMVGRGEGPMRVDVRAMADPEDARRVSRDHLQIRNMNSRVLIEDLDSTNGTVVERANGERFELGPGRRLVLEEGEQALLTPRLAIQVSGRRFPRGPVGGLSVASLPDPGATRAATDRRN